MKRRKPDASECPPVDTAQAGGKAASSAETLSDAPAADEVVVPVIAEQAHVDMRQVETGRVRVSKVIREEEQTVDSELLRQDVVVQRVPVNRFIDEVPAARREGDTLVLPVVEEVIIVEKRLMLTEEVHVSQKASTTHKPQHVTVRREEARIERLKPAAASDKAVPREKAAGPDRPQPETGRRRKNEGKAPV